MKKNNKGDRNHYFLQSFMAAQADVNNIWMNAEEPEKFWQKIF